MAPIVPFIPAIIAAAGSIGGALLSNSGSEEPATTNSKTKTRRTPNEYSRNYWSNVLSNTNPYVPLSFGGQTFSPLNMDLANIANQAGAQWYKGATSSRGASAAQQAASNPFSNMGMLGAMMAMDPNFMKSLTGSTAGGAVNPNAFPNDTSTYSGGFNDAIDAGINTAMASADAPPPFPTGVINPETQVAKGDYPSESRYLGDQYKAMYDRLFA